MLVPNARYFKYRHPELVSGSIFSRYPLVSADKWMLKQVQHDEAGTGGI
jgi:hypothetical protein